jgi:hypothetical protein
MINMTYTKRCDKLEGQFCRMIEDETGGDWSWDMLKQFGKQKSFTDKEIYLVALNLGCHDIPKTAIG